TMNASEPASTKLNRRWTPVAATGPAIADHSSRSAGARWGRNTLAGSILGTPGICRFELFMRRPLDEMTRDRRDRQEKTSSQQHGNRRSQRDSAPRVKVLSHVYASMPRREQLARPAQDAIDDTGGKSAVGLAGTVVNGL